MRGKALHELLQGMGQAVLALLTNGNLVAAQLVVEVQGLQELDQRILKRPDEERALPAACQHLMPLS